MRLKIYSSVYFYLFFICLAAFISLTWWKVGSEEVAFVLAVFLLFGWVILNLRYWTRRFSSLMFFLAFFVFLCGRELLEIIFNIRRNEYSSNLNLTVYIEILTSLSTIIISYALLNYYSTGRFFHIASGRHIEKPHNQHGILLFDRFKSIWDSEFWRKSVLYMYTCSLIGSLIMRFIVGKYAINYGYKSIYKQFAQIKSENLFLTVIDKIELLIPLTLALSICVFLKTREQKLVIGSYVFYLLVSLGSGQRANAMAGLLILALYCVREYKEFLLYKVAKYKLRVVIFLGLGSLLIVFIIGVIEWLRGTSRSAFSLPILGLLYQQGVSILVLKKEILYSQLLPSNVYYSLSAFYYGIFAKVFGIEVYHGNTVENALNGSSLSHALTYVSDPPLYINGGGIGSSFIAESHHDFGFVGIVLASIVFAGLLFWIDGLGSSYWEDSLRFLLIPVILWAPRGETTGFIVKILQPTNFLCLIGCFGLYIVFKTYQIIKPRMHGVFKDLVYSATANFLSMSVMGLLTVLIPKFLTQMDFSFWQLYVMWSIYGGYLTLGLSDGIYLRYGGYTEDKIPSRYIGLQFNVLVIFQLLFTSLSGIVSLVFIRDSQYLFVIICVCVSTAFYVPRLFLTTAMQTVAAIQNYAIVVIYERIFYGLAILVLIVAYGIDFHLVVYADLLSKLIGLFYSYYLSRGFLSHYSVGFKEGFKELISSIFVGTQILIANLSSILINGIVRVAVQIRWGLQAFGYVSLAFTLANLVVSFIQAIALVGFPYLKRLDEKKYQSIFTVSSLLINISLIGCILIYFPAAAVINKWLPNYDFSVKALALLFPMMIFEARYRLIHNTFLKALRCETYLLVNNLTAVCLAALFSYIFAFWLGDIVWTVGAITLALGIRCIFAEIRILRILKLSLIKDMLVNLIGASTFVSFTLALPIYMSAISYLGFFGCVVWLYWPQLDPVFIALKRPLKDEV